MVRVEMMAENVSQLVSSFVETGQGNELYREIEQLSATGQLGLLVDMATELSRISVAGYHKTWQLRDAFDTIARRIAPISGQESTEAILSLSRLIPPYDPGRANHKDKEPLYHASLLADNQDVDVLMQIFARYSEDGQLLELLACLAQEMVLRGIDAPNTPLAEFWERKIVGSDHPLSNLPLWLFPVEQVFGTLWQRYANRGCSGVLPFGQFENLGTRPDLSDEFPAWIAKDITPSDTMLIKASVSRWREFSNGRNEARVFELSPSAPRESLNADALLSLGLTCLEGADRVRIGIDYLKDALETLFNAASNGGAYPSGVYGAYGRNETWRSVAGFLGRPEDTPIANLEAEAKQSTWYCFTANSPWFYQVARNLGIAVLSENGRRIAVLAATDTD